MYDAEFSRLDDAKLVSRAGEFDMEGTIVTTLPSRLSRCNPDQANTTNNHVSIKIIKY